jgi:hypothetical protein
VAGNYPGIYRGICFDIADPESRLRIRVKVPQVLGDAPTGWAWPCLPAGWRDALVKTHGAHANHAIAAHSHTTAASGGGSGSDPQGGTVTVSVTTTGTTNSAGSSTQTHDHNHDAHVLQQTTPKLGEGVWVMFEGGDSDYPVWIGTF